MNDAEQAMPSTSTILGPLSVPSKRSTSSCHRVFAHARLFGPQFSFLSSSSPLPSDLSAVSSLTFLLFHISILWVRKLRPNDHTTSEQGNWSLNSGSQTPESDLNSCIMLCKNKFTCVKRPGARHKARQPSAPTYK